jgi:hypothetical protein
LFFTLWFAVPVILLTVSKWLGGYYLACCEGLGIKIYPTFECQQFQRPNENIPLFWETLVRDDNLSVAHWFGAIEV